MKNIFFILGFSGIWWDKAFGTREATGGPAHIHRTTRLDSRWTTSDNGVAVGFIGLIFKFFRKCADM
jgi:hypothetical protein